MEKLELEVISPERVLFSGEVLRVTLPGEAGAFTILPRHAPIVSSLTAGEVVYVPSGGGERRQLAVAGGLVEMNGRRVSACVELPPQSDKEEPR